MAYTQVPKKQVSAIGTGPVPTLPFYDEEYFRLEREAVFKRVWLHIGRESELERPGQFILRQIEIANVSVLIARGHDEKLRAFYNVCTHRGTELVREQRGETGSFSCRYHNWTFRLDGSLRSVPDAENFFDLDLAKCGLREIALDVCAGFVFINLSPFPEQTLRDYLGEWAVRLEGLGLSANSVFSEYVYDVKGNWKTTYNNFQEVYHSRAVHLNSIGASGMTAENPFGYPTRYDFSGLHGNKTLYFNPDYRPGPVETKAGAIVRALRAQAVENPRPTTTEHIFIFPNVTLLFVGNQCFTQTIWPLTVNRSRSVIRQYWTGKDRSVSERFAREYTVIRTLDIHSEDLEIIEAAQRGMENRAIEHMHLQVHEAPLRHTFNSVDNLVQEYRRELAAAERRT
jgi:phenylpropionate dioxygenase-like ring-hydroxylating dioxygenase large terminal subunit